MVVSGGEIFVGDSLSGFRRAAYLRTALLPVDEAAIRFPVNAAAGFLWQHPELDEAADFERPPFCFTNHYATAREMLRRGVGVARVSSMDRLFDAAAALLGFTNEVTVAGQAAMWLEHLARQSSLVRAYPMPVCYGELDYVPPLACVVQERLAGRDVRDIARAFQRAVARAIVEASRFEERRPGTRRAAGSAPRAYRAEPKEASRPPVALRLRRRIPTA